METSAMLAGYSYRDFDGSNYNRLRLYSTSTLGKAGSQYKCSTRIQNLPCREIPLAKTIIDKIMKRNTFKAYPSGISAMLFYLATCLFNTILKPCINRNSSYLDLTPLYGNSEINIMQ